MSKILKTVAGSVLGSIGGGVLGFVVGCARAPVVAGVALTAPVSYPLVGVAAGLLDDEFDTPAEGVAFGLLCGVCLIPAAPLFLLSSPFTPLCDGVTGVVLGGVAGGVVGYNS